jgi:hypothetical protein
LLKTGIPSPYFYRVLIVCQVCFDVPVSHHRFTPNGTAFALPLLEFPLSHNRNHFSVIISNQRDQGLTVIHFVPTIKFNIVSDLEFKISWHTQDKKERGLIAPSPTCRE